MGGKTTMNDKESILLNVSLANFDWLQIMFCALDLGKAMFISKQILSELSKIYLKPNNYSEQWQVFFEFLRCPLRTVNVNQITG